MRFASILEIDKWNLSGFARSRRTLELIRFSGHLTWVHAHVAMLDLRPQASSFSICPTI